MKARPRCTCEANATELTYGPFLGRPTHNRKGRRATDPVAYRNIVLAASRVFLFSSSTKAVPYFGAGEVASFWKRGSFRSGSNIGSSRSSAEVSGMFSASAPLPGIESSFCKAAMARSGSPMCAATRARISIGSGTIQGVFLDRNCGDLPVRPVPTRPLCHQGPCWSARDRQSADSFQAVL